MLEEDLIEDLEFIAEQDKNWKIRRDAVLLLKSLDLLKEKEA